MPRTVIGSWPWRPKAPSITVKFLETSHHLRPPEWMADKNLKQRVDKDWDRLGAVVRVD
jgi:hypothetical protein